MPSAVLEDDIWYEQGTKMSIASNTFLESVSGRIFSLDKMSSLDIADLLRFFYLSLSAIVLFVYLVPPLRARFLAYGARGAGTSSAKPQNPKSSAQSLRSGSRLMKVLDFFASIQVPHSWFLHFYIVSVASSMVWFQQLLVHGSLLQFVSDHTTPKEPSMTTFRILLCWGLMFYQGNRRLYECLTLSKPSTATMWIGHYFIGIAFYLATNVAIWIEGMAVINSIKDSDMTIIGHAINQIKDSDVSIIDHIDFHLENFAYWKQISDVLFGISFFATASALQHNAHAYLASLKNYTLPDAEWFSDLIAPHYSAEVVIYLCMATLSAPEGGRINGTMSTACLFVLVNLGVSADMTRSWMMEKFGADKVLGRWRMMYGLW